MEWFTQHDVVAWIGLAVLLGLTEMLSGDLILLMLAVGALAGAGTALIVPGGFLIPVIVAAVASLAMLFLVRPPIVKRFHGGPDLVMGHDAMIGQHGVVTALPSAESSGLGQAKIAGELWSIAPVDEDDTLHESTRVEVIEVRGATAVVKALPALDMYATEDRTDE